MAPIAIGSHLDTQPTGGKFDGVLGVLGGLEVMRTLHDLGDLLSGRPHDIRLTYSQHYCSRCRKYFNADTSDLAPPGSHYTHRVIDLAVRLVVEDGLPFRAASTSASRSAG